MAITVSDTALATIRQQLAGLPGYRVRFLGETVKLDNGSMSGDHKFEVSGVPFVVDPATRNRMDGGSLDYRRGQFILNFPRTRPMRGSGSGASSGTEMVKAGAALAGLSIVVPLLIVFAILFVALIGSLFS